MPGTTPTPPPEGSPFDEGAERQPADEELLTSLVDDDEPVRRSGNDEQADDDQKPDSGGGDDGDGELIEELLPVPDTRP